MNEVNESNLTYPMIYILYLLYQVMKKESFLIVLMVVLILGAAFLYKQKVDTPAQDADSFGKNNLDEMEIFYFFIFGFVVLLVFIFLFLAFLKRRH